MAKQSVIKTRGTVIEIINQTTFKIKLKDRKIIVASISSKGQRYLDFDIYLGEEEVPIEMSPFDKTRGRIDARYWGHKRTIPN